MHKDLPISQDYDNVQQKGLFIWYKYYNRAESFIHLKESVRGDIHTHVAMLMVDLTLIVSIPTIPPLVVH